MAIQTLSQRILDFFNTVQDKYAIRYRIKADPDFSVAPASGYGIDLTTAEKILNKRNALGGAFSTIEEIDKVTGVGPITLHNILYSFSDSLRAWTATADGTAISTTRKVGLDTRAPEHELDVYDGSMAIRSRLNPELVGNYKGGIENSKGLFVKNKFVYIIDDVRLWVLFYLTWSANPSIVGNVYDENGDARDIFVEGNVVYIADGTHGIRRYDVTQPNAPMPLTGLDFDGTAQGIFVRDGFAYVANGSKGLWVLDVSNPTNLPAVVTSYDTGGDARDVYVAGNYAFVADGDEGLQVFDVEDLPNPPILVTSFDTGGDARRVQVHGNHAFIADGSQGLRIIDISDPASLMESSSWGANHGFEITDVIVNGNMAYIATGESGGYGVHISDPYNPGYDANDIYHQIQYMAGGGRITHQFFSDDHIFALDSLGGLYIYKVLDSTVLGYYGKVGIGTEYPTAKLEVKGTLRLENGVAVNEFSNDAALAGNSQIVVPTEQAIKQYVDTGDANVKKYAATSDANLKQYIKSIIPKIYSGVWHGQVGDRGNITDVGGPVGWSLHQGTGQRTFMNKIDFPKPFSTPPKVLVSISSIDIMENGKNHRLRVYAKNVNEHGFILCIETWSTTEVYGATATWIAYGT